MIKEIYQQIIKETALNITMGKIDSIKKKNIKKTGCRVYENGFIGVAGTFGEATDETWEVAISNLSRKIPYVCSPEEQKERSRDLRNPALREEDFLAKTKEILEQLRNEFPDIIFSNKIKLFDVETSLKNENGLNYCDYNRFLEFELLVKHVDSVNVFDSAILFHNRTYEVEQLLNEARKQLTAFNKQAELPDIHKIPIILEAETLLSKFLDELNGEGIGRNASAFSSKLLKKAFSDEFTLYQDLSSEQFNVPFFDMEGSVLTEDRFALIDHGIIQCGYTDKKCAMDYKMLPTASAVGSYDGVPALNFQCSFRCKPSNKTLKELLNGELGCLVVMMSGGDYTNEGDFASPVQTSYLTDGEKLLGKLPEFNVSGNMYDLFGADYIGCSKDKPLFNENFVVTKMKISQ